MSDSEIKLGITAWPMPDGTWSGFVVWDDAKGVRHAATAAGTDSCTHAVNMMMAFRNGDYSKECLSHVSPLERRKGVKQ